MSFQQPNMTNEGAKKMMDAAISKAEEIGIPATVAIVDAGGHMILLSAWMGAGFILNTLINN